MESARPDVIGPVFQEAKLEGHGDAELGNTNAEFGLSVSVSGDTAVIGSPFENGPDVLDPGAAYVFVRSGTTWTETHKLTPSDEHGGNRFGTSVAISGTTVVVGAPGAHTPRSASARSAYVFVRSGAAWTQEQKLVAADGAALDSFGTSVSVSGDTAIVGAFEDDSPRGQDAGSAYVFVRSGEAWTQQAQLLAPEQEDEQGFGLAVSISGDSAVVGAPQLGNAEGAVYVFVRSGTSWTRQQILAGTGTPDGTAFGFSVSISGETVVAAAPGSGVFGIGVGSAYVFVRSGTVWSQHRRLVAADGEATDDFGYSVSISGDSVVVGALGDDTAAGVSAGSAYVFGRSGTVWSEQQKLTASDAAEFDTLGGSVSISGDTVVLGAHGGDTPRGEDAGSAYVFVRSGTVWTERQKLIASDGGFREGFGSSVLVSGDTVVVGVPSAGSAGAGAAYVFREPGVADLSLTLGGSPDPVAGLHC